MTPFPTPTPPFNQPIQELLQETVSDGIDTIPTVEMEKPLGDECCADLKNSVGNYNIKYQNQYNIADDVHDSVEDCNELIGFIDDSISYGVYLNGENGEPAEHITMWYNVMPGGGPSLGGGEDGQEKGDPYWGKTYEQIYANYMSAEQRQLINEQIAALRDMKADYEACTGQGWGGAEGPEDMSFYASADTPFDQAFALLKMPLDEDMIQKFTDPYGTPQIPFTDFIDYYPELLTENLEDLIPHLPEGGDDTRVHLLMPPHHQPIKHLSDEEQAEIYGHRSGGSQKFPEPIRESGWWYEGYGDPGLRTLARGYDDEGKPNIIEPPPISDLEQIYFQTGLQQQGAGSLWNRAHYENQLKPTTWESRIPDIMGESIPRDTSQYSMPRELEERIARKVFPKEHWGHHVSRFNAGIEDGNEDYKKWGVPPFVPGDKNPRFYERNEQPEWREMVSKPFDEGERHHEIPISEAKYPKEMGESINFEGQTFKNTQDLIAHLLSTPGQEEWSEKKRSESDAPFGGVAEGHDTRGGRKAARRTKRMQDRNE